MHVDLNNGFCVFFVPEQSSAAERLKFHFVYKGAENAVDLRIFAILSKSRCSM